MNKKITIRFDDLTHLYESCSNYLKAETMRTLESHPDIFTKKYQKMFDVSILTSVLMFTEEEILNKQFKDKDGKNLSWKEKVYSKNDIADIYNKGITDRLCTPAKAHMRYYETDGKIDIQDLYITINADILKKAILRNLWRMIEFQDVLLKSWARHEAGHILDYILTDGTSVKEHNKVCRIDDAAKKKLKNWRKSVMPKGKIYLPDDLEAQYSKMYFECPSEARADTLGGVDRQAVLEFEKAEKYVVSATIKSKIVKKD